MPTPHMPRATLLLTRPEPQSRAVAAALGERPGLSVLVSPLLDIVPVGTLPALPTDTGILFTSANGVRAWAELNGPIHSPCFTVGDSTAEAALAEGFQPRSASGDADALLDLIRAERPDAALLHVRGRHARGDLARRLTALGIPCDELVLYDQKALSLIPEARAALDGPDPVIVPLFSPRTAQKFALALPCAAPVHIVAMSPAVADTLSGTDVAELCIADRPDREAMTAALREVLAARGMLEGGRTGL